MASGGIVLVLVAHNGKTLQLDVAGTTRVDAVQQALVSFTGVAVADQILMCRGARLDPAKPLAAYKLPVANPAAAEDHPVFLYHKAFLRPGARPPPLEPVPQLAVQVPQLEAVTLRHPLEAAHSPLVRALPEYERQFEQQLVEARAYWETSQQRMHWCRQLLSEQEVQARAADAARANVEGHYTYICALYQGFVDRYVPQYKAHSRILATFQELTAALSAVALPPQLRVGAWATLADLQPQGRLAEWYDSCRRSHDHFAVKVSELEGLFQLLRGDVEALFMQAPTVDLDALGLQLGDAEQLIDEEGSTVQVLSKDLRTVRGLVEDVVAQLGASAGGASLSGAKVHDAAAALEAIHDSHLGQLLPRVRACDGQVTDFLARCVAAKEAMGRDVLEQLQRIAAQQSRIREMKDKLAAFGEVLSRQAAAFAELRAATRLPAAYRLMLTECARRSAWQTMYSAQATRLAEAMARVREREGAKREGFLGQVDRLLPRELLAAAGLLMEAPHCQVSVPPGDEGLLPVDLSDVTRLPAILERAAADMAAAAADQAREEAAALAAAAGGGSEGQGQQQQQPGGGAEQAGAAPSQPQTDQQQQQQQQAAAPQQQQAPRHEEALAEGVAGLGGLELENARLKAELAALLALQAARDLSADDAAATASSSAGAAAAQQAAPAEVRPFARGAAPPEVPASVRAALPSVASRLAEEAAADAAAAGGAAAAGAAALAGRVAEVAAALAAKDGYADKLRRQLADAAASLAAQEARLGELEAALEAQLGAAQAARLEALLAGAGPAAAAAVAPLPRPQGGMPYADLDHHHPLHGQHHEQQQQHDHHQQQQLQGDDSILAEDPTFAMDHSHGSPASATALPADGAAPGPPPRAQPAPAGAAAGAPLGWHHGLAHSVFSVGSAGGGGGSSMRGAQSVWAAAPRLPAGSPLGAPAAGGGSPAAAAAAAAAAAGAQQAPLAAAPPAAAASGAKDPQPPPGAAATSSPASQSPNTTAPVSPGTAAGISSIMSSSMRYFFGGAGGGGGPPAPASPPLPAASGADAPAPAAAAAEVEGAGGGGRAEAAAAPPAAPAPAG
ncbi:MAG: hypothetical protein J3K34DRAFT_521683 [Monoraphidium minutum]|nr:MAG: hypothetical protein J3K34DRAFT_521683 [Monoraphidium minutum]